MEGNALDTFSAHALLRLWPKPRLLCVARPAAVFVVSLLLLLLANPQPFTVAIFIARVGICALRTPKRPNAMRNHLNWPHD